MQSKEDKRKEYIQWLQLAVLIIIALCLIL